MSGSPFFSNMHLISDESAIADASSVIQLNPIRSLDLGDVIGIFSSWDEYNPLRSNGHLG